MQLQAVTALSSRSTLGTLCKTPIYRRISGMTLMQNSAAVFLCSKLSTW